jgi:hypothetical protein
LKVEGCVKVRRSRESGVKREQRKIWKKGRREVDAEERRK